VTPERFAKLRRTLLSRQPDLTVVADSVNKSHNVSAILRTADAVGVYRIHAVADTGVMRRHHMIAGGAKRWVDVVLHPTIEAALAVLHADGWQLLAAHASGRARDYRELDYTHKVAVMVGAELIGLSSAAIEQADEHIAIPMRGLGTSLNVSVATAVILMEAERQRAAAGLYEECRLDPADFERTLFEWCYPEIAERCRHHGLEYPALKEDGSLTSNPLLTIAR
jgi:tRNA (guanosine-2'-O-)-methyltransferase